MGLEKAKPSSSHSNAVLFIMLPWIRHRLEGRFWSSRREFSDLLQRELITDFSFEFFYLPYIPQNIRDYSIICIHYNRTLLEVFWASNFIIWKHVSEKNVSHSNTYYADIWTIDLAPRIPRCPFSSGSSRCTMRKLIDTTSKKKSKLFSFRFK